MCLLWIILYNIYYMIASVGAREFQIGKPAHKKYNFCRLQSTDLNRDPAAPKDLQNQAFNGHHITFGSWWVPEKCTFHGHIHFKKNSPIFLCQHNICLNQLSQMSYVPLHMNRENEDSQQSEEGRYRVRENLLTRVKWSYSLDFSDASAFYRSGEFGQVSLQPSESNCTTHSCPLGGRRPSLLYVSYWLLSQTSFLPLFTIQNIRGKLSSPCTLSGWLTKSPILIFLQEIENLSLWTLMLLLTPKAAPSKLR